MVWRVVATQQGQYNQCIMDIGMVFDLLLHDDGTYPVALKHVQKKDEKGALIPDEWDSTTILGKDNRPVHRDFAEDLGNKAIKSGPKKGEVMRFGWMKRVPDRTPLGLYPVDENGNIQAQFWDKNVQLPQAFDVGYHPWTPNTLDRKRNHAAILSVLPKEEEEAA
jgi:hypothetical protein